jgi:hypothetical protein
MNEQRTPGPQGRRDEELGRPGLFDEVDFEATQTSWPAADLAQTSPDDDPWGEDAGADVPEVAAEVQGEEEHRESQPSETDEPPSPTDPDLRAYVESEAVPAEVEAAEAITESEAGPAFAEELEEQEIEPGATPLGAVDAPLPEPPPEPVEAEVELEADWDDLGAEAVGVEAVEPEEAAAVASVADAEAAEDRSVEGRLARLHLRGGLVSLARAELETMAGQGTLDGPALADLAEARWRSGDLLGAGEAAQAHIARGGDELMALVVAAEALTAQARTVEARRIAAQVVERTAGDLEPLFAGQPRALVWPRDGVAAPAEEGSWATASTEARPAPELTAIAPVRGEGSPTAGVESPGRPSDSPDQTVVERSRPTARDSVDGGQHLASSGERAQRAVARELEAIEWSVEHGHFESLPGRLAIVLQTDPSQAARVLELTETAVELIGGGGELATELLLVSGDAYQVLGRKEDAAAAYRASARAMEGGPPADASDAAEIDEPRSAAPAVEPHAAEPSVGREGERDDEAFDRAEEEATVEAAGAGSSWGSADEEADAEPEAVEQREDESEDREPYDPERWQRP